MTNLSCRRKLLLRVQRPNDCVPRKDKRGFDLISDALPFGGLWYGEPNAISNAVGYAKFSSRIVLVRVLAPELEQAPNLSAQR
jgi:hypothetical protein